MRKLPPVYFFSAIIIEVLLHFSFPLRQFFVFPWRLLGLVFLAIGITLNVLADQTFKRLETTVKPFEESTALLTGGVFSISRNPMYLGMTLILLGIGNLLGSISPFTVVPVFVALLDQVFIVQEERMLMDTFGEQFRHYQSRVRRWI